MDVLDNDGNYRGFHDIDITSFFYDKFLYVDDMLIDFLDCAMTADFDLREEDITMPTGEPGRVYSFDVHSKYLGRDFYRLLVDTVYQYSTPPMAVPYQPKDFPSTDETVRDVELSDNGMWQERQKAPEQPAMPQREKTVVRFGGSPRKVASDRMADIEQAVPRSYKGPKTVLPGITEVR